MLLVGVIPSVSGGFAAGADQPDPVALSEDPEVLVVDNAFEPDHAVVASGATVTWVGGDNLAEEHNVVADAFESDLMSDGTFTHQFDRPGTYEYLCTLHPEMTGVVGVE